MPYFYALLIALSLFYNSDEKVSVSGYVTDATSDTPLVASNITLLPGNKGTSTNISGFYELADVKPGVYTIVVSYIGYQTASRNIVLVPGNNIRFNISLKPKGYRLEELVVKSDEDYRNIGLAHLDKSYIDDLPSAFGADLFRTLQLLPGIKASSDFSSGLYVRGGSPDQTLILFDHAPVYNPSHFFGFYSTFDPNALGAINLFKGNYPAEFGGRLGSVLTVSNKAASQDASGGNITVGMLSTSASLEEPLNNKGSWMLSMRRSTVKPLLDVLRKSYSDIPENFYFLDINAKLNLDLNPDNKLSFSFYSGNDHLDFPFIQDARIKLNYGNQILSSTWKHIFSNKTFSTVNISGSRYFNAPRVDIASTPYKRFNNIYDISTKANLEYLPNKKHALLFGAWMGIQRLHLKDQYNQNETFTTNIHSLHSSLYLQDDWQLGRRTTFSPGLRINFTNSYPVQLEPRVSLAYRPTESLQLQAAYGRYTQFLTLTSNGSFSGLDVWLATTDNIAPIWGNQYAFGIKTLPWEGHKFDVELYYRSMFNLFEPDPSIPDRTALPYEEMLRFGEGYAWGIEFLFERHIGNVTGLASYTHALTRRRFPGIAGENSFYPTNFDRPHDLNVVLKFRLNSRWSTSAVFNYASGQPYTQPLARSISFESPLSARGQYQIIGGPKNGARMPPYHRLDLGIIRKGTFFGFGETRWHVQVINVYSRRNIWFYRYDLNEDLLSYRDEVLLLPILPSISYSLNF